MKKITEREFLFALSIGVKDVAVQCDETMTECLKIGGSAIREGTSYIYRDPQSAGSHVTLQVVSEDEVSISVDNWHPVGSSKEQGKHDATSVPLDRIVHDHRVDGFNGAVIGPAVQHVGDHRLILRLDRDSAISGWTCCCAPRLILKHTNPPTSADDERDVY
ncbi:MAG: hypothetical protein WCN98_04235 [Verrucomicrobiaceae bacterium]